VSLELSFTHRSLSKSNNYLGRAKINIPAGPRYTIHGMRRLFIALTLTAAPFALSAQTAEPKTAEQAFHNIVQLKDIPADQLIPTMQFISSSLGVECSFCHVEGKMELDEKPTKRSAREMMAMMMAINKNNFGDRREVTCYSCHHGSAHPASYPPVQESDAPAHAAPAIAEPAGAVPTVDQITEKYVAALGGAEAIHKITSRVLEGKILVGGNETPIEVLTKAPNKRVSISHMSSGESFTAFDGTAGWMGSTGRPAREMSAAESGASGLDAEFYLAPRLKEIFTQLRRGRPEEIGGVECETLIGTGPGRPPVRLYFDQKSGLLVRMVRFAETPLGRNPTQIDYADYREVDGVKTPFRWTLARPNGRFTIQIADEKTNVPIDDAKFAKPTGVVK
jgi:photosynthetic reaction center cytochrome c subunit